MIIVNVYSEGKYKGRYQLERDGDEIVWLYILGTWNYNDNNPPGDYLSLHLNLEDRRTGNNYLKLKFEESDLDRIK